MWIFASRLPEKYLLIAPRGLYKTPLGGYGWYPIKQGVPIDQAEDKPWPRVDDLRPAVEKLIGLIGAWPARPPADFTSLRIAGFSQGAALAYTFTMLYPEKVTALAGLAGFLPDGAASYLQGEPLMHLLVYVSHGVRDKLVPIARAWRAVEMLDGAGAQVSFCESDVGHKLSADCFKGMEVFFQE